MELEEVDAIDLEPPQTHLALLPQILWPPQGNPLGGSGARKPGLRRDDEALRVGVQRLGDELFADVRTVAVGRVDEVDAELDRAPQDPE
jgi:hypothetical protein